MIFKNKILTYQSKADIDEKIWLVKSNRHLDLAIREVLVKACFAMRIPHSILFHNLLVIEIKNLLKLKMHSSTPHKSWTRMECGILDSDTTLHVFSNC